MRCYRELLHAGGALLLLLHEGGDGGARALAPGGGGGHVSGGVETPETGHIGGTEHSTGPPPVIIHRRALGKLNKYPDPLYIIECLIAPWVLHYMDIT